MAKMIGLSRSLKLTWLNQVVEYVSEGLDEKSIKDKLNEYLSFEIKSPTNIRKTREILMYIWFYENESTKDLKPMALNLIKKYPEYSLEIHWAMMLAVYPVFDDICKYIGKMSEFQGEILLSQLKQKLFDVWGERTTIFHSTDKVIATLKNFGVIQSEKPGKYDITYYEISKYDIASFLISVAMKVSNKESYTMQEMTSFSYLFPFKCRIEKELLLQDAKFSISGFGGDLLVSIN